MKQGEIWLVALGYDNIEGHEQKGNRPFYIVSNTTYNGFSNTPVGFFLSTSEKKKRNRFSHVVSTMNSAVNVSQIRTLSADRFIKKMGEGTKEDTQAILRLFNQTIIGE